MISLFSILLLGFFLGMRHATDPDHVVAVTAIVSRERTLRAAAPIGAVWGLGHSATILVVGGAIILFGIVIPPRVGLTMEFSVAVMLVLLGGMNLSSILKQAHALAHQEEHARDSEAGAPHHGHHHGAHGSILARLDQRFGRIGVYRFARPLMVGVVHGLAGSAAVALLVLTTIRAPALAIGYLALFGAGTIAGMLLITTALAMPFAYAARRFERLHRGLGLVSGLVSLAFGVVLIYQIGFVDGLFTSHPHWNPQ